MNTPWYKALIAAPAFFQFASESQIHRLTDQIFKTLFSSLDNQYKCSVVNLYAHRKTIICVHIWDGLEILKQDPI